MFVCNMINLSLPLLICLISSQYVQGYNKDDAMAMLKKYNYMGVNNPHPDMDDDQMFTEALMNFQNFAGMNETGELDSSTIMKLMSRRCGMPDIIDDGSMMKRRRKRYALSGAKWIGTIGYNFKSYPQRSKLTPSAIRTEVKRAFDEWSEHANLTFKELLDTSDIEISFERMEHGDKNPFDGQGMTLAHAFFPSRARIGGDLHFDDDEEWCIRSSNGVDIFYVALHEIGHSLGLQHSSIMDAIMYPYYPGYNPNLSLTKDDVSGIQALYGARYRSVTKTPMPTPPTSDTTDTWRDQFCLTGTVDATGTLNGRIFVFQGELYTALDSSGIVPGYPRLIQSDWQGHPMDLDAALSLTNHDMLLLFKGTKYWRYVWGDNDKPHLVDGYPRTIRDDFTGGLPETIDVAFTWSDNGRVYIIKDDMYYRVRNNIQVLPNKLKVRCDRWYYGYPTKFSKSWHINEEVSDVLMYHGRTFFMTGKQYLRYKDNTLKPDARYPMTTSETWFGCKPPGSLLNPQMEMEFMERDTQYTEIHANGDDAIASAASCLPNPSHILFVGIVIAFVWAKIRG